MSKKKVWLELAKKRNINYPGLDNLLNGYYGEDEFAEWLKEYGNPDWLVYRNIWLSKGYQGEIDFVIFTPNKWIMIEVKNYDNFVTLGENQSYIGDYLLDKNPVEQVQRTYGILKRIATENPFKPEVEAVLVFMNTHCKVVRRDQCFGIPIYERTELRNFLQKLNTETQDAYFSQKQFNTVKDLVDKYRGQNPYETINLALCDFSKMSLGLTCGHCQGRELEIKHRFIHCNSCGYFESKSKTLVRMAKEYCLLYQKNEFTRQDIYNYIEGKIRLDGITKILSENFQRCPGRQREYYMINTD